MRRFPSAGVTLVELLVAMTIASIVGSMIMQLVIGYQSSILVEISRNDLQDRAERLIRFLANDIRETAFLLGPAPQVAGGAPLSLVHDSLNGDPSEALPFSILAEDINGGDDRLKIVKAISFSPPLRLAEAAHADEESLVLNRRPNRRPGSSRELQPSPEAINHLLLANQPVCYSVQSVDLSLQLEQPLLESAPAGTELLGVRAYGYQLEAYSGAKRLRRDDFSSRDILDDAVDGMQFEYLLADGSFVDQPADSREVRGVRISLLVRDLRLDRRYTNDSVYRLANQSYGPFHDHYRRHLVSKLVEVKNHALQ